MCGITGFWSASGLDDTANPILKKMTETLFHRGPDGYGYAIDKEIGLAFGHSRLSIIDLECGAQPIYSHDRSRVIAVNGEFYDFKRIRARLNLVGTEFVCKSDSEIALHLYERKGLDFMEDLRGEFAFSLYDQQEDRLILVRDRFGIKPLFYHINNGNIYWGSEVKSLLAHPKVPRQFNRQAALHQLMQTMVPGTSAFEGIHALRPGHMLIISRKGDTFDVKDHKYWDMDFPTEHQEDYDEEEYIELVRAKLLEAVQLRLEADVPVGCYLSGGIDSCSMLGLASAVQQSPVKAYTISFDSDEYDESTIAREMAERVQADQEVMNLSATDLYGENYLKTVWHSERTFYNTLGVAKWCMSRRVRESGYKTVVTGEGADEMFGGYPAFKRDMFRLGMTGKQAQAYQKEMDKSNELFTGAILAEELVSHPTMDKVCGFTPSWIQPWMHTLEIARPLLSDDVLEELKDYDPIETIANSLDASQVEGRHPLDVAQYTWIKTMLECQILNWGGDRVDMANSMESRPAFLDHHVAEAARTIPPHLRIKGNTEKYVLREAMKHILPETLYKREKFAFMAPPSHTEIQKKKAVQELIDSYMNEKTIKDAGLCDPNRLTNFVKEYQTDTDPVSQVRKDALLNHLLCLHIMHHQFIEQPVAV